MSVVPVVEPARAKGGTIRIADFDFDLDKDGTTDEFEKKVLRELQAADADGSGELTPQEMVAVLRKLASTAKENKRLGRQVSGLACLVVLLIGALTGVAIVGSMVGGEAIKESRCPTAPSRRPRRRRPCARRATW